MLDCVAETASEDTRKIVLYTLGEYLVRHTEYTSDCVAEIIERADGALLTGIKNALFNYQDRPGRLASADNKYSLDLADKFEKQANELEARGYVNFFALLSLVAECFRTMKL